MQCQAVRYFSRCHPCYGQCCFQICRPGANLIVAQSACTVEQLLLWDTMAQYELCTSQPMNIIDFQSSGKKQICNSNTFRSCESNVNANKHNLSTFLGSSDVVKQSFAEF